MKRWLWQFDLMLTHRRHILMLLAAAVGIAAIFMGAVIFPEQQVLEAMRTSSPAATSANKIGERAQEGVGRDSNSLLPDFPALQDLPKWLSFIFSTAGDYGISLNLGGYHYEHTKGEPVGHYHVDIPVTAEYPAVRALIVSLMNGMPFASLDELMLNRQSASDSELNATLRMTLNLRDGQGG